MLEKLLHVLHRRLVFADHDGDNLAVFVGHVDAVGGECCPEKSCVLEEFDAQGRIAFHDLQGSECRKHLQVARRGQQLHIARAELQSGYEKDERGAYYDRVEMGVSC